jgi:hypothetical protein
MVFGQVYGLLPNYQSPHFPAPFLHFIFLNYIILSRIRDCPLGTLKVGWKDVGVALKGGRCWSAEYKAYALVRSGFTYNPDDANK